MAAMIDSRMDGTLGVATSRRGVLRTLGGVAVAGAVGAIGLVYPAGAKRKQHKKKKPKPSGTPGQTVTKTFANTAPIAINSYGSATPFPSRILVSGFDKATISDVDLVLKGFNHVYVYDVDVMLVAPFNRNALVMSDSGSNYSVTDLTIRLDDTAGTDLPSYYLSKFTSGTYRPTNIDEGQDIFDTTYAPVPSGNVALSTFDGGDPNGEWQLFIRDDTAGNAGSLDGGWELTITAMTAATKKKKKHKRKR